MSYYIEAFRADGTQIFGNLDGQASLRGVRYYRRTLAYRHIAGKFTGITPKYPRVRFWQVFDFGGQICETIYNPHHEGV